MELLASTAVMDECESYETLKTNRNSPNRNFIFFYIYLRFGLVCYFLSRQKEHTDAHLLFMRQTYLRSFHFFAFKFQQRKNVAAQLSLYSSFFSFCSMKFLFPCFTWNKFSANEFWRGPCHARQVVCIPSLESPQ
jgi:hypothetical protein